MYQAQWLFERVLKMKKDTCVILDNFTWSVRVMNSVVKYNHCIPYTTTERALRVKLALARNLTFTLPFFLYRSIRISQPGGRTSGICIWALYFLCLCGTPHYKHSFISPCILSAEFSSSKYTTSSSSSFFLLIYIYSQRVVRLADSFYHNLWTAVRSQTW